MKVHIKHTTLTLTKPDRDRLEADVDAAFARFGDRVARVLVHMTALEAPDNFTSCRVEVGVVGADAINVTDTDTDMFVALGYAATRAARAVQRTIEMSALPRKPATLKPARAIR